MNQLDDLKSRFEKQTSIIEDATKELGELLIDTGLEQQFSDAIQPLITESEQETAKGEELRESHEKLSPMTKARVRLLERTYDEKIASGDPESGAVIRQEIEDLQANLQNILDRAIACDNRVEQIEREAYQLASTVFATTYPEIRKATVAVQRATVGVFSTVWTGFLRFQEETDHQGTAAYNAMIKQHHQDNLTALEQGEERSLFQETLKWFGGRR
jgi:hypothetical protein